MPCRSLMTIKTETGLSTNRFHLHILQILVQSNILYQLLVTEVDVEEVRDKQSKILVEDVIVVVVFFFISNIGTRPIKNLLMTIDY